MSTTPSSHASKVSRRSLLARTGVAASALLLGSGASAQAQAPAPRASTRKEDLARVIGRTPFIDTHEHLIEESRRTNWKPGGRVPCNDWALLCSHYLDSDLRVAGMPGADYARFMSPDTPVEQKWSLIEPYWPAVRHTGYAQAVRFACRELYEVPDLNARTISKIAAGYARGVRPGFYRRVLKDVANIESCQVNSLESAFMESEQPFLLMQDLSILTFSTYGGSAWTGLTDAEGRKATDLASYHRIIDHTFAKYAPYAVAVKSQVAYQRRLDFDDIPAEQAANPFLKLLAREPVSLEERKAVDDHLFWYCVRKATAHQLPVKLHTGYYAGHNGMPLSRVVLNPPDVADLLRRAPDTTFVLMHIGYPCQDEMIALAKHYANAVLDLCWAWIINPAAAERFVREFLVAAPANKLLTFGGDYIPVEPVVGHAVIARRGLTGALQSLVQQGWLAAGEAVELVDPLMHGNARRIFRLDALTARLRQAPWVLAPNR